MGKNLLEVLAPPLVATAATDVASGDTQVKTAELAKMSSATVVEKWDTSGPCVKAKLFNHKNKSMV